MNRDIFIAPALFDNELTTFFAKVNLGPVVEGSFSPSKSGREDSSSLTVTDRPLASALFFNQKSILGRPNPLYGVVTPAMLMKLFSLYAREAKLIPNKFFVAPPQMRELLPKAIAGATERAIENGKTFDLEHLCFVQFASLSAAARLQRLRSADFESLEEVITEAYRPFFPDEERVTPQMVIGYQERLIDLAVEKYRIRERTTRCGHLKQIREVLALEVTDREKARMINQLYQ